MPHGSAAAAAANYYAYAPSTSSSNGHSNISHVSTRYGYAPTAAPAAAAASGSRIPSSTGLGLGSAGRAAVAAASASASASASLHPSSASSMSMGRPRPGSTAAEAAPRPAVLRSSSTGASRPSSGMGMGSAAAAAAAAGGAKRSASPAPAASGSSKQRLQPFGAESPYTLSPANSGRRRPSPAPSSSSSLLRAALANSSSSAAAASGAAGRPAMRAMAPGQGLHASGGRGPVRAFAPAPVSAAPGHAGTPSSAAHSSATSEALRLLKRRAPALADGGGPVPAPAAARAASAERFSHASSAHSAQPLSQSSLAHPAVEQGASGGGGGGRRSSFSGGSQPAHGLLHPQPHLQAQPQPHAQQLQQRSYSTFGAQSQSASPTVEVRPAFVPMRAPQYEPLQAHAHAHAHPHSRANSQSQLHAAGAAAHAYTGAPSQVPPALGTVTVTRQSYTPQRAESPAPQISSPYDTPRRDSVRVAAAAGSLFASPQLPAHLPSPYSSGHDHSHGDASGNGSGASVAANRVAHITHQLTAAGSGPASGSSSSPSEQHRALSHRRVPSSGSAASAAHNNSGTSSGSSGAASAASTARGLGTGRGHGTGAGGLAQHYAHASTPMGAHSRSPVSVSRALPSSARTHSSASGALLDADADAEDDLLALRALSDAEQDEEDLRERRFVANSRRGSLQLQSHQAQPPHHLQQLQYGDATVPAGVISHRSSSLTRPSPPPIPSAAAGRTSVSIARHNGSNHHSGGNGHHGDNSGVGGGSGGDYHGLGRVSVPSGRRIRGLVGLANLGNTCFLASTLQCLLSTPGLVEYFASGAFEADVNPSPKASRTRGSLARAFGALARRVAAAADSSSTGGGHLVERPLDVKRAVSLADSKFAGYGQHDSHEFGRVLLAALHDELNRVVVRPPYEEIKDGETDSDAVKAARWWRNYAERNDSVVSACFAGQLQSSLVCQKCKGRSEAFDPFMDLSLPIPKSKTGGGGLGAALSRLAIGSGGGGGSPASRCTLSDCFSEFVKEELLTGHEQVYCRRCRAHRDQSKRLRIRRWPRVLLLHLKRFSYSGHARAKIAADVDFPTELDLTHMQTDGDDQPPAMSVQRQTHSGRRAGESERAQCRPIATVLVRAYCSPFCLPLFDCAVQLRSVWCFKSSGQCGRRPLHGALQN